MCRKDGLMKWVVIILSILFFNTLAFLMKKRLKVSEIYNTIIFGLFSSILVDIFASFRYKAWGFFEEDKAEFSVMLITFGIYPAVAAMIINWYPYKSVWWMKISYLMGWTIFSTVYEWLTVKVGILWHINWNLYYSFILYPFIYYMLILHVRMYRWMKQKEG
jgi:hypothetical protein